MQFLNNLLDKIPEFLVHRKGLLPLIGILLILVNLVLQFFPVGWVAQSNLLLHIGLVVAILGLMVAWAV
jgi:hypothetical protein